MPCNAITILPLPVDFNKIGWVLKTFVNLIIFLLIWMDWISKCRTLGFILCVSAHSQMSLKVRLKWYSSQWTVDENDVYHS